MAYNSSQTGENYIQALTFETLRHKGGASGSIVNSMIDAAAAIATSKMVNRVLAQYIVADGTTVAATSGDGVPIYTCLKTGGATLKAMTVVCPDAPSGGDLTFTVDLQKADAAAAAATMLTGVRTYPNATADYTQLDGALDTTTIDDGDTLLIQVAVSGSTGVQGQGLIVLVEIEEAGS